MTVFRQIQLFDADGRELGRSVRHIDAGPSPITDAEAIQQAIKSHAVEHNMSEAEAKKLTGKIVRG
jgi:hypothetical protein